MIEIQKKQFGSRSKISRSICTYLPIQSQHLDHSKTMELELILSKNGSQWSRQEMEFIFTEFFINRKFIAIVKRKINHSIPESDREDMEQEFYVYILQKMVNYDSLWLKEAEPINRFIAFLRRYLYFFCLGYYRNHREDRITDPLDEPIKDGSDQTLADLLESDKISPEEETVQNQQTQKKMECVKNLPPKQQRALVLYYLQGKSYSEIAELEEVSENTIRKRVHDGRKNLYHCFKSNGLL